MLLGEAGAALSFYTAGVKYDMTCTHLVETGWHAGNAEPLKHGGFGPQYGGTSYQERVTRMQARTGEDRGMRTEFEQPNTHVYFDANGIAERKARGSRARRLYGRR